MIDTSIKFVGRPNCMSGSQPLSLNKSVNLRWCRTFGVADFIRVPSPAASMIISTLDKLFSDSKKRFR